MVSLYEYGVATVVDLLAMGLVLRWWCMCWRCVWCCGGDISMVVVNRWWWTERMSEIGVSGER